MSGLVVPAGVDVRDLEAIAVDIATSAGRLVVDDRPRDLGVAATKSSVTDIVTVMDQRSQDHLLARLDTLRPMDAVMGEEKGGRAGTSGITWVVDPIDGTVNYLYDLPAYAVSVAAVVGDPSVPGAWQPIAGAVVNPVSGETFRAALRAAAHFVAAAQVSTDGWRWAARRRPWPTRWSPRASRMPRRPGPSRPDCSSNCSRRCATSGGSEVLPSTSVVSRPGRSTRITSETSILGTWQRGGSS